MENVKSGLVKFVFLCLLKLGNVLKTLGNRFKSLLLKTISLLVFMYLALIQ